MKWAAFIAVINAIAALLYYLIRRQRRRSDVVMCIDPHAEANFYPEIEKCHEINTRAITCSCTDFRKEREQFRHDDPRRLCKHLVRSFIDAGSVPEDLSFFKEGILRSAEDHSGFPSDRRRFDKLLGREKISLMVPKEVTEEDPWIDIYCEAGRYRYSPERERWADEKTPPQEEEVIRFLYEKLGDPIPEAVLNLIKTVSHTQPAKDESPFRTAEGESGEFQLVESLLRTLLPPEGELALRETKSYIAVTVNGPRKWICRLYVNGKKSKYIEFPGGARYELHSVEDIGHYKEQLMKAYSEKSPKKGKARLLFPMNNTTPSRYRAASVESRDNAPYFSRN